ncbi:hypothetical protein [Phormidium tenue]|uniref:hypothetical protein n=1 Tax=Phormidium tenue TaxID=126344 RepID=UPI0015C5369B|nr:hypothetical protein [Phormidium tenue]MBD2234895.1 hypothetical protein [Phormidium tenue FACHB-1052]
MPRIATAVSIELEILNKIHSYVNQRGDLSRIFQEGLILWIEKQELSNSSRQEF